MSPADAAVLELQCALGFYREAHKHRQSLEETVSKAYDEERVCYQRVIKAREALRLLTGDEANE